MFDKIFKIGWKARYIINKHYMYEDDAGTEIYKDRRFKNAHLDLRLERLGGNVDFHMQLIMHPEPNTISRHQNDNPKRSLLSWAIPEERVPTLDSSVEMVQTANHPIEFLYFTIPFATNGKKDKTPGMILNIDIGEFEVLENAPALVFYLFGKNKGIYSINELEDEMFEWKMI
jgi:hypothetical protein